MIDISLMSKQEKIIIITLFALIIVVIGMMSTPAKMRNERQVSTQPQNILDTGGGPGADRGFFATPKDIGVDKEGNIYIVDSKNNRIQKFNSAGNFILAFGKEGDGPGDFKEPCGIDIGPTGNVYVADTWNGRVEVFSNTGSFLLEVGKDRQMWGPRDVGVDREGNIYVCDTGFCRIEKFDEKGRYLTTIGKKNCVNEYKDKEKKVRIKDQPGMFGEPFSIKQGPDGNMYVLDRKNFRIQVLAVSGRFIREWAVKGWADEQVINGCLMEPYLEIDAKKKRVYVSDSTNHRVLRYDLNGGNYKAIDTDVKGAKLMCPIGVAVLPEGQILAVDHSLGKIVTLADK
jgi:tripartite motif-containing protein 71